MTKRGAPSASAGMPTPRVFGEPWRPDFTNLTEILQFMASVQHAYAMGHMETDTARVLLDAAYRAGSLLTRHESATAEKDVLTKVLLEAGLVLDAAAN